MIAIVTEVIVIEPPLVCHRYHNLIKSNKIKSDKDCCMLKLQNVTILLRYFKSLKLEVKVDGY